MGEGLDHRRLDCPGNTWPSPSQIVWKRKAFLPVWVGSGEALASQRERWIGLQRAIVPQEWSEVLLKMWAGLLPFSLAPSFLVLPYALLSV